MKKTTCLIEFHCGAIPGPTSYAFQLLSNYGAILLLGIIFFLQSCATYDAVEAVGSTKPPKEEGIRVYLIGDAGILVNGQAPKGLQALEQNIKSASEEDLLLFLGDNIYPKGMSGNPTEQEKKILQTQLDVAEKFIGRVIFIPGNHDWYSGMGGLRAQEKMVDRALGKNSFLPEDGFPMATMDVSEDVLLLVLDSEWYMTNWDRHPGINNTCNIKTREDFLNEFRSIIKKNQNKTILLAIHHPLASRGNHNGQLTRSVLLFPVDILRRASGVSPADLNFPLYREFSSRISTILQEYKDRARVIVVSGHEHNLQYLEHRNIPQVISGSGSKVTPVRHYENDSLSYGYAGLGFAVLSLLPEEQNVHFYNENNQLIHTQLIRKSQPVRTETNFDFPTESEVLACIYEGAEDTNPKLSRSILGKHYRDLYYRKFQFPVVDLDTLHGGLKPVRVGGGFQTVSLRLENKDGKEYVMRRMRKSAAQFIQRSLFPNEYLKDQLDSTLAEKFLFDFYTTAYPFGSLLIGCLSDAAGVFHANPNIYYVPRQKALGAYNELLGNDLYLIEERLDEGFEDLESFGNPENVISTDKVLEKLKSDEEFTIELNQYIKTRLFDIWLGDWDRHQDQYRWRATKNEDNTTSFAPIPRDRDQAFPKFDGFLIALTTRLVPQLRKMQSFGEKVRNLKNLNPEMYKVDKVVLKRSTRDQWLEQARFLQKVLTDEAIEKAIRSFPAQLKDHNFDLIIKHLKSRRKYFLQWAEAYYDILRENVIVHGTNKDDLFEVTRLPNGFTQVKVSRIKSTVTDQDILLETVYDPQRTKEIWLYGLGDQDEFEIKGSAETSIRIKVIGGQEEDTYRIENTSKLKVYDFKSENSVFEGKRVHKRLTHEYELNNYDFNKYKKTVRELYPILGFNPDDGLIAGAQASITQFGLELNPFTYKHGFDAKYYSATSGFAAGYSGELANMLGKTNARLEARYTTPVFSQNFFGLGNETKNLENERGITYYRTRLEQLRFSIALLRRGRLNNELKLKFPFEYIRPNDNENRFVDAELTPPQVAAKRFAGVEGSYSYRNKNREQLSTLGFGFALSGGWKANLADAERNFAYLRSSLKLEYPLLKSHQLNMATAINVQLISNDEFEFYQASNIGGASGLRGFRNNRFSGRKAYTHSTDLRLHLLDFRTGILPAQLGIYSGFDYGRVWVKGETSNNWHTSYGGGLYIHMPSLLTLHASFFGSSDGGRFTVGAGFGLSPHSSRTPF